MAAACSFFVSAVASFAAVSKRKKKSEDARVQNCFEYIKKNPTMKVEKIDDSKSGDHWRCAVRSDPLKRYVAKVDVSAGEFRDQGWGNFKASLGLSLYNADDELVERCNLFGVYRSPEYQYGNSPARTLTADEPVVAKAEPGCTYRVEYIVGGGGGHVLHVQGFECKFFLRDDEECKDQKNPNETANHEIVDSKVEEKKGDLRATATTPELELLT